MSNAPTLCPQCGSAEVHRRQSRGDWVCDVCEHQWQPAAAPPVVSKARAKVFLSYGRRDGLELANRVRADLEARGYDVWQDTVRIRSGKEWEQEIQNGLRDAQVLVALLSPHAVRKTSDANTADGLDSVCLDEISFARFSRPPKPVVPVMAVPCEPPFCIYRLDYIDLTAWQGTEEQYRTGLNRLIEAVEATLRGEVRYRSWDHQLRPWDFSAFLNEKRQHFCGREWLFEEIEKWRTTSQERALLIVGDPGTGKSAIVAELVHRNPGGQVLAYHCCQADTQETLQPARFVRSMAAMIASQLDAYAACLSDPAVEEALSESSCARDPASAFEAGILTPLEGLPAPPEGPRYLLIDALDEALDLAEAATRTTIVEVLGSRLQRLPSWLRVLATTRKERAVLDRLRGLRAQQLDAHDPRNLEDLDRYIALRLQSPVLKERLQASGKTAEEVAGILRAKADGNILYVIRSLEGIERDLYGFNNLEALPPGLYGLYLGFFQRHFPDEASFKPVRSVLEVIVAARRPLTEERIARSTELDREAELPRVLRRLSAYLPEQEGRYTVYHKSFADWLTAPDQRGSLHYVSRQRGHERLADLFWREYQQDVRTMSGYGVAHLPTHLVEAGRWEQLAQLLCDLRFLESKCRIGMAYELQADYDAALGAWPGYKRYDPLEHAPVPPLPEWASASTTALLSGAADPFPDKGAGPLLVPLRALSDVQRDPGPQKPRYGPGERIPESQFGPDLGTVAATAQMRRTEAATASGALQGADTPVARVQAFATFVSTHNHMLAAIPRLTAVMARNHAASGPVATAAETLASALIQPWISRDPRPPALPSRPACLRTLEGHNNRANSVALTADGKTAVSASSDATVRVWDLASGVCLRTLQGHRKSVRGVALTADGKTLVSCSHDNTLRVWDLPNGTCRATLRGHTNWVNGVALSGDGRLAVSGSSDNTLRVWDLTGTGRCLRTLEGHTDEIRAVAVTLEGKLAVSASSDTTLRIWDVATGASLRILRGHTDWVNGLGLTPDGRTLISGGRDLALRVWDVASGACLRTLEGSANWVNATALSPDGRLAISVGFDLGLRVWSVATGECLRLLHGHTAWVSDVTMTPDGRTALSAGSDHTLRVWDVAAGECQRTLPGHTAWVCPVVLSPDQKTLVSPSRDQTLRVWDAATGQCRHTLAGHGNWVTSAVVRGDGKALVSTSSDGTLRVWDIATGKCLHTLQGHTDWVHFLALTPDSRTVVSGGSDCTVRAWDAETGACVRTLQGHTDWVHHLTLSPDGRFAVSACRDRTLRVWDLATGECRHTLAGHTEYVEVVAMTPDGQSIVSASGDTTLRVWDLATGACRHTLRGHTNFVENLTITPDGKLALSASRDYTVRIWDLAAGTCVRTLQGHLYGITGVSVSPDGKLAISSSWDNTVRVWVIATGECLAIYHAGGRVPGTTMSLDGRIFCGASDGQLHFLRLRNRPFDRPLITAVRVFHMQGGEMPADSPLTRWLPFLARWLPPTGPYDRLPTALCPGCGRRFVPAAKVLDTISGIGRSAGLAPGKAPSLVLPPEAWNDAGLASECPQCKQRVQFNPFVVDSSSDPRPGNRVS